MIHKPKHRSSERGMGLPNCTITSQAVGPSVLVTTEVWNEIGEPWRAPEGFVFADTGYKWVTKWEEGKNHTVTEFIDASGNLVGAYYDIGSIVTRTPGGFEYDDWYLDVFQPAGGRPVLLDEDELEQAVQVGYLTEEQAEIAYREATLVMRQLEGASAPGQRSE